MIRKVPKAMSIAGLAALMTVSAAADDTRVWVFCGIPGDAEHDAEFKKNLSSLKASFIARLQIAPGNLHVYYGGKGDGFEGESTRENLLEAVEKIAATTRDSPQTAQWVIFMGHANEIRGGTQLNLSGPDLSSTDLAAAFQGCNPAAPISLLFTHTASAPFVRQMAAPGRVVITANSSGDTENETEFPGAFADALAAPGSDANKDGKLDATEIYLATKDLVLKRYKAERLKVAEAAQIDGDGDGRATQRPAEIDAAGAAKHFFTIAPNGAATE